MKRNTNILKALKSAVMLVPILLGASSFAQSSPVEITGSVDTYFRANLNATNSAVDMGSDELSYVAPATSFANRPGFALGMINIIGNYEKDSAGIVADLVFGPRGNEAVFGSPLGSSQVINQLYVYWNLGDATFTFGNFNTFLGYEVISPSGNYNYSTSYMFSYGPFSHSGFKVDYDLGKGFSAMAGVFNPTDLTEFNPTSNYLGGGQVGYCPNDDITVYVNAVVGDQFHQIDLTTGFTLSKKSFLGVNATYATDNFAGAAGYYQYVASEELSIGTRIEYFEDLGVGAIGLNESVVDATVSLNYAKGNLMLIPEYRIDVLSSDGFVTSETASQSKLSSFLLAAVYAF